MKLLLFDVDATLILTGGAGVSALNRTFNKMYQIECAMDGVAPQGKTDPAIVREVFRSKFGTDIPPGAMVDILTSYIEFLSDEVNLSQRYEVLPGIIEMLDQMSSRSDVLLGLATGNVELGARIKLQRGDLNRYFSFGGYGSDSESRVGLVRRAAEHAAAHHGGPIAGADIFVIGDTPRDIEAGREAGFRTVGVATGQYSVQELLEAGADFAISDFRRDRDYFLRSTFMV